MKLAFFAFVAVSSWIGSASGTARLRAYANDFVDPDYIIRGNFGGHTIPAQKSIVSWAKELAKTGPWSVIQKSVTPPSGDKHDYMSWAPYWWPDCSNAGNTTVLTDEKVWTTCTYKQRDGQFNPDRLLVNDIIRFQNMSEAVLYNSIAWTFNATSAGLNITEADRIVHEANTVSFLKTWFLDSETRMSPNLDYGQMRRGPNGQKGSHTGLLDLKGMAKVATAIHILRKGNSTSWTSDLDGAFNNWCKEYISWLETAGIALQEGQAKNNHGTYYYNQLAALKLIVGDLNGAKNVTDTFFDTQFLEQIDAKGDQPEEAARTHPYHYRNYNLAAMITNARLAAYIASSSPSPFTLRTRANTTIQSAVDFVMSTSASASNETKFTDEIYPNIAAVASAYGDPDGKYLAFVKKAYPGFLEEPFMLWDQPWALGEASASDENNAMPGNIKTQATTNPGSRPAPLPFLLVIVVVQSVALLSIAAS